MMKQGSSRSRTDIETSRQLLTLMGLKFSVARSINGNILFIFFLGPLEPDFFMFPIVLL